ncbi:ATP-binding protein [Aquimarina sp. ERC-38]|uniref:sensor histidine kinase n=1 Tax=Aquimarina sp. ERC-38 TaxID=2949996 RepID=UPI0022486518|nr:ATP-binding protein [Aquimarina sp. ERC-38]UZO82251.1 ATP-binding protein [Aquimarina sp. ERC-38]
MTRATTEILERALQREKTARKQAEAILEQKSKELYERTQELKAANTRLENLYDTKNNELQGVFNNLVDAYILMNTEGKVIEMNQSAKELFGYDIQKKPLNVTTLIYKDDKAYAMKSFQELLQKGAFTDYKARVYTKNKGVRSVHINASLIKNNDSIIGAQGIVRDITEQLQQEQQREELLIELESNNKELQDFAHVVSHDLKSPLRSMNALITWLKEDYQEVLDQNAQKSFNQLLLKVEKMDHLIEGILRYSSIERTQQKNKAIDLNQLINEILEVIHYPDHIQVQIIDELPVIQGDRFRLQQLFQNLISNAIKYNDKEKGIITLSVKDSGDYWEFEVSDNGPGIPEAYHQKVFEIFQTITNSKESTGVGLSIVKKVVDLYKGEIKILSNKNGATFRFTLHK